MIPRLKRCHPTFHNEALTVELLPPVEHLLNVLLHDAADVRQILLKLPHSQASHPSSLPTLITAAIMIDNATISTLKDQFRLL
jgi:hypothetical protein